MSRDDKSSYLANHQWAHPNLFYKYQKLETPSSFRLLQLQCPRETNAPSHYALIETTFDHAPPYETLSYVWGTNDRDQMVTLKNGKFLRVTKLLKEALAFIERKCSTGYLWIDQVCIDQDDMGERGDQVKIMGRIYASCMRVLVWLGRMATMDTELRLADDLEQSKQSRDPPSTKDSVMKHLKHRLRKVIGSGGSSTGNLWLEILRSPWFQRAWVFQEIVLPPAALFIMATMSTTLPDQALTVSLSELHTMLDRQALYRDGLHAVVDTLHLMYRRCSEQRDHVHTPIEQSLSVLAPRAKTSEELDRLYAFFGLNFNINVNLTPSYSHSLEEAMIDTATSIIEGTSSLDIFEVIPRAVQHTIWNAGIPTWTPDFREEHLVVPFKRSTIDFRDSARSSRNLSPMFISTYTTYYRGTIYCAGEEKRTIQAEGFVLDHVETEIGSLSSRTNFEIQLDTLLNRSIKAWNRIRRSVEKRHSRPSRHENDDVRVAKPPADLGFAEAPTMARLRQALVAEGCCDLVEKDPPPWPTTSDPMEFVPLSERTMTQVMHGRTLWMTRSGRLALGSYLQTGDCIFLAYGCSNPIALRGENDMAKVLGTCFLEGWMDPWSNGNILRAENEFTCTTVYIV